MDKCISRREFLGLSASLFTLSVSTYSSADIIAQDQSLQNPILNSSSLITIDSTFLSVDSNVITVDSA